MGALSTIRAAALVNARLRSHWGEWREVQLFAVDLIVADRVMPAIHVIGDEVGEEIVLGRGVLNWPRLLLDGPARSTEIVD